MVFVPGDAGLHLAPFDNSAGYGESWWLQWYAPDTGLAGAHQLTLDHGRRTVAINTWLLIDGQLTASAVTSPLADVREQGAGDLQVDDLTITSLEPLRSFSMSLAGVAELRYDAAVDAFQFSMSGQRIDLGTDSYDSVGTVTGRVRVGGRDIDVSAPAFHRHAWGTVADNIHPVQAACAVFSDDLFFSIVEYDSPAGRHPLGYLFAAGEFHGVEKIRFRTAFDTHGRPGSCDLLIATADRRDFRVPGAAIAANGSLALATFRLAGCEGGGVLAVRPTSQETGPQRAMATS
jgi:hypothetical protein